MTPQFCSFSENKKEVFKTDSIFQKEKSFLKLYVLVPFSSVFVTNLILSFWKKIQFFFFPKTTKNDSENHRLTSKYDTKEKKKYSEDFISIRKFFFECKVIVHHITKTMSLEPIQINIYIINI